MLEASLINLTEERTSTKFVHSGHRDEVGVVAAWVEGVELNRAELTEELRWRITLGATQRPKANRRDERAACLLFGELLKNQ